MIQIGGAYTTLSQDKGILLQKYRDRNAILFKVLGSGVDTTLLKEVTAQPQRKVQDNFHTVMCSVSFLIQRVV